MIERTGQGKLNEALHENVCDGKWSLRVVDPCTLAKLEEIRALLDALDSGGAPATKRIFNETIVLADTEQSLVMPAMISGYLIRSRGGGIIRLSHVLGESGTNFITVPSRATHSDEHRYTNLTIYFQSNIASEVIEVVAWET